MTHEELAEMIRNLVPVQHGGKVLCLTLPIENCTPLLKDVSDDR